MEENRINMPPPPKELANMPPPPPKFGAGNGMPVPPQQPPKREDINEENVATTTVVENVSKPVENTAVSQVGAKTEDVKPEEKKKTEKVKHKPVGGIRTFLYWLGFVLSLGAVGVLIYLLVK